jgi:hypothetical protein
MVTGAIDDLGNRVGFQLLDLVAHSRGSKILADTLNHPAAK